MFSFKTLNASPTLKGVLSLITPSKNSVPHHATTLQGMQPGCMVTTGYRKPKALATADKPSATALLLVLPSSSPPAQSSSLPMPWQVLHDIFGDDWKLQVLKESLTPTGVHTTKHLCSKSPCLQDTPSKHPKYTLSPLILGPLGTCGGSTKTLSNRWVLKRAYRPPLDPKNIINISEDINSEKELKISHAHTNKYKAWACVSIPPDAKIIKISDKSLVHTVDMYILCDCYVLVFVIAVELELAVLSESTMAYLDSQSM